MLTHIYGYFQETNINTNKSNEKCYVGEPEYELIPRDSAGHMQVELNLCREQDLFLLKL